MIRRHFLKSALTAGAVTTITIISPSSFAKWNEKTFNTTSFDTVITELGADNAENSDKITIGVPDIAENGNIVPIKVSTSLKKVSHIHLLVKENPSPLVASFKLSKLSVPALKLRAKVGKPSDIIAIIQVGDKMYKASKHVNVTIGGCE